MEKKCAQCGEPVEKEIMNLCADCLSEGYRRVPRGKRWEVVER